MNHTSPQEARRFSGERASENMLKSQILTNRVLDASVLEALARVPRRRFALPGWESRAYADAPVPSGPGRWLPTPMVFARLLQEAQIAPEDRVLDVACGNGYSSHVLGFLSMSVTAVDDACAPLNWSPDDKQGYHAPRFHRAPPAHGLVENGPYHVIHINGMILSLPEFAVAQLAEGGRAVAVQSRGRGLGEITVWTKVRGMLSPRFIAEATLPPLALEPVKDAFRF